MRPHCDVFVHGFAELSVPLLRDYERPRPAHGAPLAALVVAGSPEPSSPELVARLADEADYVVVADGGADVCRAAGVAPDVLCGDGDSASPEASAWARAAARSCVGFPTEKYATDLALALDCARHEAGPARSSARPHAHLRRGRPARPRARRDGPARGVGRGVGARGGGRL